MNLSRNQYGYRDPTAEKAITHIMSEQKRKERRRRKRMRTVEPERYIRLSDLYHIANKYNIPRDIRAREEIIKASATVPEWKDPEKDPPPDDDILFVIVNGKHGNITFCHAIMTANYYPDEGWELEQYPDCKDFTVLRWQRPELPVELRDGSVY